MGRRMVGLESVPPPDPAFLFTGPQLQHPTKSHCPGTGCGGKFRSPELSHVPYGKDAAGAGRALCLTCPPPSGLTNSAQAHAWHLPSGLCSHKLHCNKQRGKSFISGVSTWDGKEQDKLFCCSEACIQALLSLGSRYGWSAGIAAEHSDIPVLLPALDCIACSKDKLC